MGFIKKIILHSILLENPKLYIVLPLNHTVLVTKTFQNTASTAMQLYYRRTITTSLKIIINRELFSGIVVSTIKARCFVNV